NLRFIFFFNLTQKLFCRLTGELNSRRTRLTAAAVRRQSLTFLPLDRSQSTDQTPFEAMAGYSSNASEKKSSDAVDDIPILNAENLQNNLKIIYYSRTFLSIIGGVIAGILGFTSLTGFIFYFLVMAITSIGLAAKAGFSFHSYFESWNQILLDGFLSGLMVCILCSYFLDWKKVRRHNREEEISELDQFVYFKLTSVEFCLKCMNIQI
ncbi:ER membrane protein complex subunit 6, partial [Cucurbita argyrosperma subsp. argyrosperma]